MGKLTKAQVSALKMIRKRDWPAGEPRPYWVHKGTWAVLQRQGLAEERFPGTAHLTDAGRRALAEHEGEG